MAETNGNTGYGVNRKWALSTILVCPKLASSVSRAGLAGGEMRQPRPSETFVSVSPSSEGEYRETDLCRRGGRIGTRCGNHDYLPVRRIDRLYDGIRRRPRNHRQPVQSPPESLSMMRRSRLVGRPCSAAAGSR